MQTSEKLLIILSTSCIIILNVNAYIIFANIKLEEAYESLSG